MIPGPRRERSIARALTGRPPGGFTGPGVDQARAERIARHIAQGYARQAAEGEAEAERTMPTPAERMADLSARMDREAAVKRADRAWRDAHGPTPTGVPEREPGSLEHGRALYADQQRRRA